MDPDDEKEYHEHAVRKYQLEAERRSQAKRIIHAFGMAHLGNQLYYWEQRKFAYSELARGRQTANDQA